MNSGQESGPEIVLSHMNKRLSRSDAFSPTANTHFGLGVVTACRRLDMAQKYAADISVVSSFRST